MLFSFSLGTYRKKEELSYVKDTELDFRIRSDLTSKYKDIISNEMEKYGNVSDQRVKLLADLTIEFNLNPKTLVAADQWIKNNNNPEKLTYNLFNENNFPFKLISSVTFENRTNWGVDAKTNLLTYALLLKERVYSNDDKVILLSDDISDVFYDFNEGSDVYGS